MVGVRQERLSGFAGNNVMSEITMWDADTNAECVTTCVNRSTKTVTESTVAPNSILYATNITVNGLLIVESTTTVATPTLHGHDALGRETSVTSPLGFTAYQTYNALGQLSSKADFTGVQFTYDYYPNGVVGAGLLKSETGPTDKKTYHSYTLRGEPYHTWGDVPYPEERAYSDYGELVNLSTFRGGSHWSDGQWPTNNAGSADTTTWIYQQHSGMLTNKTDAAGKSVSYTYVNGMLESNIWARAVSSVRLYDSFGDITAIAYSDATPSVQFLNYNRSGQPRQIMDGAGSSTLVYDHANRLVSTYYSDGLLAGIAVTNHFDSLGRRNVLAALQSGTPFVQQSFGYDASYGRMQSVSSGIYSAWYGYMPNSDFLQTATCKSNSTTALTTTRTWEYGSRLSGIANVANGTTVTSHSYLYDSLNRRWKATLEDGSYWQYGYNDRDELTSAHRYWPDASFAAGQQFAYDYDNSGNRKSASSGGDTTGANLRTEAYTANALNEYINCTNPTWVQTIGTANVNANVVVFAGSCLDARASRHGEYFRAELPIDNTASSVYVALTNIAALPGGGSADVLSSMSGHLLLPKNLQTNVYDPDGNLTFDGIWTYEWNAENRLVAMSMTNLLGLASTARLRLEFVYDFLGRRIEKMVYHWNSDTWLSDCDLLFVYDGWNILAELGIQNAPLHTYLWGLDLSGTLNQAGGVGGLVAIFEVSSNQISNCHFPAYDGNGNITALVRAGDLFTSARYDYSPYGETLRASGSFSKINPFRFSTKYADEESGFIYYAYRYYSPQSGKWIGRDPTTDQIFLNLYLFCKNNPIGRFDSDGRKDWLLIWTGAFKMIAGLATTFSSGLAELGTGGLATPLAVGGVMSGGFMWTTGFTQFMDGITEKGSVSCERQRDLDLPDSLGGYLGKMFGKDEGSKVGDFIESSVYLLDAAHSLGEVGKALTWALGLEFANELVEFTESAWDGLRHKDGSEQ
jgi:RHS repeat-associated protein